MLEVKNIYKNYEGKPLLRGVSFDVQAGETVCLLGRSGSGKSTLLRLIAGLEQPEGGWIGWDGQDLASIPVHKRQFGLMFQEYALFPHRNVLDNVKFGLRMLGLPRVEIQRRAEEALEAVHMSAFMQRRVTDLSGGEQQRVALARTLAPRPRLVMLDEPLGALDRALREQLGIEIRSLLHETGIPAVYVTHDQEEAFTIADRLIVLKDGQIVQSGTPDEVYSHPSSAWVARFFGQGNLLPGVVLSLTPSRIETALGVFETANACQDAQVGSLVTILLRPNGVRLADGQEANLVRGRVTDCIFRGEGYRVAVRCIPDMDFIFYLERVQKLGEEIQITIDLSSVVCLDREAE